MGTYDTRTRQNAEADKRINNYRAAAAMLPALREVCKKYDGKVYNKRFPEALSQATGEHIFSSVQLHYTNPDNIDLYYYGEGNHMITLFRMRREDMKDGKRINAAEAIKDAATRYAEHLQRAAELERIKAEADTITDQIEQVKKMLAGIVDGIPYEAQEIFGLYARVTRR